MTKCASLVTAALNGEGNRARGMFRGGALHAKRELRHYVFPSHIRAINVVRTEDQDALKITAAKIDRHDFADDLGSAIGIARVHRIGYDQRHIFAGRNLLRRLIDLCARSEDKPANAVSAAGVDHVDYALDPDLEHQVRGAIEEFGTIDEGEMMHLVNAPDGYLYRSGIAHVAGDEFDNVTDFGKAARGSAGIVVKDADRVAFPHQSLDERGADETGSAGDEDSGLRHGRRVSVQ